MGVCVERGLRGPRVPGRFKVGWEATCLHVCLFSPKSLATAGPAVSLSAYATQDAHPQPPLVLCCAVLLCCIVQLSAANRRGVRTDELSASELVVTSAFSKMVASTITYPHEVVRSYMHVTGVLAAGGVGNGGCFEGGRVCGLTRQRAVCSG